MLARPILSRRVNSEWFKIVTAPRGFQRPYVEAIKIEKSEKWYKEFMEATTFMLHNFDPSLTPKY